MQKLFVVSALVAMSLGCAGLPYMGRVTGATGLFTKASANEKVTESGGVGSKTGQACSNSILGLVTMGDASVAAAAKAGGIHKVATVDNDFTNYVGVYATYCVNVSGE